MVDMRRRGPEPPWAGPEIEFKPGMAREMLRELAPLLAEEGIHVDEHGELSDVEVPDLDNLQRALDRAVERQNLALFTPTGRARELAATALRQVTEAIADGDTARAAAVLDQIQPESPDYSVATVAGCTGVALGLLDEWLSGRDPNAAHRPRRAHPAAARALDRGRAGTDVLVLALAAKGRAFRRLDTLTVRHGGHHLLYGSALAAAGLAWARQTGAELAELTATIIR